jgi:hypothetical protein
MKFANDLQETDDLVTQKPIKLHKGFKPEITGLLILIPLQAKSRSKTKGFKQNLGKTPSDFRAQPHYHLSIKLLKFSLC